jgi:PAS domain S-box-containing protein
LYRGDTFAGFRAVVVDISAQKKMETEILEREEKFRSIFENSPYPIAITSIPENKFLEVNKAFLDISGYTEGELRGRDPIETGFIPLPEALKLISRRLITGTIEHVPLAVTAKGGERVHVLFSSLPVTINHKPAIVTVTAEVTKLKRVEEELLRKNEDLNAAVEELTTTEEELRQNYDELSKREEVLRESEEKFRVLVELSLDGIIITDFLGTLLFANRAAGLIVDAPDHKALIGKKNVMEYVAPESRAGVLWDFGQVALGIDTYLVNYKLITETKREVWVECIGKKIQFEGSSAMLVSLRDVTERTQAVRQLQESENKFSSIFRCSPVSLTLVSATDGKFVDVNDTFLKSTGYSREEVVGRMPKDVEIFADTSEHERFVSILQKQQTVEGMELRCRRKDGEIRVCRFSSGIIMMDGKPLILSSIEDVTGRKKTEEALRESEERFRKIFDASPAGMALVTPERQFISVNPAFASMTGYTGEELGRMTFIDITHPDHLPGDQEHLRELAAGTIPVYSTEKRYIRKDKSILWGFVQVTAIRDAGGSLGYFIAQVDDITDRKRTEEALRESERKFRSLVEHSLDGILILDLQGTILFANTAAARTIEADNPSDCLGRNVMEFIAPESREDVLKDFLQIARGHDAYLAQYRLLSAHGNSLWIESIGKVITYEGKPADIVSIRDITERKQAGEALRQANKKLTILSGVTRHDIKNQLITLNGFATLLKKEIPDAAYETYFSHITNASNRILNMIQFTKEYEQIGVRAPAWQDLHNLADTAAGDIAPERVTVKNDLPATLEVFADPLIAKVFFNLIDNAIRHGEEITTIRFSFEERNGERIIVCADDGPGVAMDEKERIFDRGFGKNSGFGLAISREILDITGLTITETGEPGKGARFEIAVPNGMYRFPHQSS